MPGLAPGALGKLDDGPAGLAPGALGKPEGVGGFEKEPGELKPAHELGLLPVELAAGPVVPLLKFGLGQDPGRVM